MPARIAPLVVLAFGAAGLGYLLPNIVLARLEKRRQHRIRLSLPDALDLLVVCVEAGLSLDAAINRVGHEIGHAHPALAENFAMMALELRAGGSRADRALHREAVKLTLIRKSDDGNKNPD